MKQELIKYGNLEKLAKLYFDKGLSFTLQEEFGKASEYFKESLDYITCDCDFKSWDKEYDTASIFDDLKYKNINPNDYLFVKGFLLSYTPAKNKQNQYLALDAINRYLKNSSNEYGEYIKFRIEYNLNENDEELFNHLSRITKKYENARLNYRLGRIGEEKYNVDGLAILFRAFISNPSSACCARILKETLNKKMIILQTTTEFEVNPLVYLFKSDTGSLLFWSKYLRALEDQPTNSKTAQDVSNFLNFIHFNSDAFLSEGDYEDEVENEDDEDEYHYSDYEDSSSSYDNEYYNDALDMDQQSPEFWDSL